MEGTKGTDASHIHTSSLVPPQPTLFLPSCARPEAPRRHFAAAAASSTSSCLSCRESLPLAFTQVYGERGVLCGEVESNHEKYRGNARGKVFRRDEDCV